MFILDLPDDLLEDVFDRDDALGSPLLVDDQGNVHLLLAHLPEQLVDGLAIRDHHRLPGKIPGRLALAGAGPEALQQIIRVEDADDVVDVTVVDRDPREPRVLNRLQGLVHARRPVQSHHIDPRHHDLPRQCR